MKQADYHVSVGKKVIAAALSIGLSVAFIPVAGPAVAQAASAKATAQSIVTAKASIGKKGVATLEAGDELTATLTKFKAKKATSSKKKVAEVTVKSGKVYVKALKKGTAKVTAKKGKKSFAFTVKVVKEGANTLTAGKTKTVKVKALKSVKSSKASVASVKKETGKFILTAKKAGAVVVTAKAKADALFIYSVKAAPKEDVTPVEPVDPADDGNTGAFDISKAATGPKSISTTLEEATSDNPRAVEVKSSRIEKTDDIIFDTNTKLTLDLMKYSNINSKNPAPLVVFIPGGGFTGINHPGTMAQRMAFAQAGYVVASVNHRVLPTTFPSPLQDIKSAIRFLKANASKYGIDKNKVAVAGNSAGGYFATMVGVTSNTKTIQWPNRNGVMQDTALDVGDNLDESSAVNAVIDLYGVSDLTIIGAGLPEAIEAGHHSASTTEAILLDGAAAAKKGVDVFENTTKAPIASPFTYIDENDPPFLMMHGDKDTLVSPLASYELYNRLTAAGVPAERYTISGASHGGDMFAQPKALKMMTDFLDTYATVDIPAETEGANDTSKAACGQDTIESTLADAIAQNPTTIEVTDWNISEYDGIAYKTVSNSNRLYMDILQPALRGNNDKKPLLVWINGGGFTGSSPTGYLGIRYKYAQAGFVVASIQHRTVPTGVLPAPLQDAKQAVRYLRAHADQYGIDKDRVAVFGASAGGYFASMLGVTGNTKSITDANGKEILLDTGDYLDESSAVNAVVDFYGVSDLTIIGAGLGEAMEETHTSASNTEALLVNGTAFGTNKGGSVLDFPEKTALYSPFTYVDKDDPAFIMFHGDKDTSVSPVASMELKKHLLDAGLTVERTTITDAGHGGDKFYQDEITEDVITFLKAQLG